MSSSEDEPAPPPPTADGGEGGDTLFSQQGAQPSTKDVDRALAEVVVQIDAAAAAHGRDQTHLAVARRERAGDELAGGRRVRGWPRVRVEFSFGSRGQGGPGIPPSESTDSLSEDFTDGHHGPGSVEAEPSLVKLVAFGAAVRRLGTQLRADRANLEHLDLGNSLCAPAECGIEGHAWAVD